MLTKFILWICWKLKWGWELLYEEEVGFYVEQWWIRAGSTNSNEVRFRRFRWH